MGSSAEETSVMIEEVVMTFASLSMKALELQMKPEQDNKTASFPKLDSRLRMPAPASSILQPVSVVAQA